MKNLYIIGAGGSGRETAEIVYAINEIKQEFQIAGFIDDDQSKWKSNINDIKVLGGISYLKELNDPVNNYAVVSITDCKIKERIVKELEGTVKWCNIIHPTSIICSHTKIGIGNIIEHLVYIGPNVQIDDHVFLNHKTNIGHDAMIEDYSSLMDFCDINGYVHLEKKVYAGSRVSVTPGCTVGESAKLGAGAVIMKDVRPGVTMHGHRAVEAE